MQRRLRFLASIALLSAVAAGCARKDTDDKEAGAKAMTSTATAVAFDKSAEAAAIHRQDELWVRSVTSKNLDSLTALYASDAILMFDGTPAAKGSDAIRKTYAGFLKANPRDIKLNGDDASFSDDGTVAYEHGSFTGTVDGPGGKPMKVAGDYLSVLKKEGGVWKLVEDISNSTPLPGK